MLPHKKKRPKSKSPRRPASSGQGDALPAPAPTPVTPKSLRLSSSPSSARSVDSIQSPGSPRSPRAERPPKSPKTKKGSKPRGRSKSRGKSRSGSRDKSKSGSRNKSRSGSRNKSRSRSRDQKRKKKQAAEAEAEQDPWRPRSSSELPDYENIVVTESMLAVQADFRVVLDHLARDEGLKNYTSEFVRLFEAAAEAHDRKQEVAALERQQRHRAEEYERALARLREELEEATANSTAATLEAEGLKAELDASRLRELSHAAMAEDLRKNVERYQAELQQLGDAGAVAAAAADPNVTADYEKYKRAMVHERQEMAAELAQVKKRLNEMYRTNEELQRKNSATNLEVTNLGAKLQEVNNAKSLETRLKEKLEEELEVVVSERGEQTSRQAELAAKLRASQAATAAAEQGARELRIAKDKAAKEAEAVRARSVDLTHKLERLQADLESLRAENHDKSSEIRNLADTITKLTFDLGKAQSSINAMYSKLGLQERRARTAETSKDMMAMNVAALDRHLNQTQREAEQDKREIAQLQRQREALVLRQARGEEAIQLARNSVLVAEQEKRSVAEEIEQYKQEAVKQRRIITELETERECLLKNVADLTSSVHVLGEQLGYKERDVLGYERRLEAADTKFKKQVNLYEELTVQRNKVERKFEEARQSGDDARVQVHVLTSTLEQLKETATAHEVDAKRLTHALAKAESDKTSLTRQLNEAQDRTRERDARILNMEKTEAVQKRRIADLEVADGDLHRDLRLLRNEKDIIGTQLVRRNDEIHLLRTKVDVLQELLASGKEEFAQRVQDIRLLKIEVRKLRREKLLLQRELVSGADLRKELCHLSKDLAFERQRRAALEEELQSPMNLHRWRRLEATDPATLELVHKISILQKRLLRQHGLLVVRERQLRDSERLYLTLRATMVKLPGPDVLVRLKKAHQALDVRGRRIKSLFAELSMSEAAVHDFRVMLNRTREELADVKSLYYTAKKKLDALGHSVNTAGRRGGLLAPSASPSPDLLSADSVIALPPIRRPTVRSVRLDV